MANNPPTVLLMVDQLGVGGLERQVVELLKGLQQHGRFRTALAVLDHGGGLEPEAARYAGNFLALRRRARYDVTPVLGLLREVRRLRVDLIHAFGWMSNLAALVTARLRRLPLINGGIRAALPQLSLSSPADPVVRSRGGSDCGQFPGRLGGLRAGPGGTLPGHPQWPGLAAFRRDYSGAQRQLRDLHGGQFQPL